MESLSRITLAIRSEIVGCAYLGKGSEWNADPIVPKFNDAIEGIVIDCAANAERIELRLKLIRPLAPNNSVNAKYSDNLQTIMIHIKNKILLS